MQSNKEERNIQQALGSIPKVNNQRAFSCTVTVAGTGLGDVTVNDITNAIISQHQIINNVNSGGAGAPYDQLYVHRARCYGTAGGYLSMAPYPHRFNYVPSNTSLAGTSSTWNSYEDGFSEAETYRRGNLCQQYEFGINGATRPELVWDWPKDEIINNPFIVNPMKVRNEPITGSSGVDFVNNCKMLTVQSTNVNGNALYIIQFDVTLRNSDFIEIAPALGAAAFGEKNVVTDNYLPPLDLKKKAEEGNKAEELANKKRKVENVKALTMPTLDSH